MKQLKISIHKGTAPDPTTTIKIPLSAIKIVNTLLPKKLREKMLSEGYDLQEIFAAIEVEGTSGKLVEIHNKDEHIVISAE